MPDEIDRHVERHLGTLHDLHTRGPKKPLQKSEADVLLNRGLIEPAGERGQFGMTYYKLTEAGTGIARNVNLSGGKYSHVPGSAPEEPAPAPAPSDEVPPGYMRMKNGKILKIANR